MQVLAPDVVLDSRTLAEAQSRLQRIAPVVDELIAIPGGPPLGVALGKARRALDTLTPVTGIDTVPVQPTRLADARDEIRQLLALTLLASSTTRFQHRKHRLCGAVEAEVLAVYLAISSAADAAFRAADVGLSQGRAAAGA